ncbi:MAG: hypothetical protein M0P94_04835 [Candidatus Absconditabacterales bacterium]|nr:hypothetical protein [Candidatus Absconditabacterales bacterium]
MTNKQKTEFIKMCLFYYFRISKQCKYICSEFGKGNADIFAENEKSKKQYEVEIKVSKSDFNAEFVNKKCYSSFKILKHSEGCDIYKNMYFYVCVPEELKEYTKKIFSSDKRFSSYGILTCDFNGKTTFKEKIKVIKIAKKQSEYKDLKEKIISRMSSEIFCSRKQYVSSLCKINISSAGIFDDKKEISEEQVSLYLGPGQ